MIILMVLAIGLLTYSVSPAMMGRGHGWGRGHGGHMMGYGWGRSWHMGPEMMGPGAMGAPGQHYGWGAPRGSYYPPQGGGQYGTPWNDQGPQGTPYRPGAPGMSPPQGQ